MMRYNNIVNRNKQGVSPDITAHDAQGDVCIMIHDKFGGSYVFDRSDNLMRVQKVVENGEFAIARFRLSSVSPLFMRFISLCSPHFWLYIRRYAGGNYEIYNYSSRTWNDFQIKKLTNDWSFRELSDTELDDTPEAWFSVIVDSLRGCKK